MKLETGVILLQGVSVTIRGAGIALATGLAQWVDSDVAPSRIAWIIIITGAIIGGASQLSSFLSTSFGQYLKNRSGNGNGGGSPPPPPSPTKTTP